MGGQGGWLGGRGGKGTETRKATEWEEGRKTEAASAGFLGASCEQGQRQACRRV